jgi:hypothetical protein
MNKKWKSALALAAFGTFAAYQPVHAQQAQQAQQQPIIDGQAADVSVNEVLGTVVKVDHKKRDMTVKGPQGAEVDLHAGPEVRNFDQIKAGDKIRLAYQAALITDIKKAPYDTQPSLKILTDGAVAKPGTLPGVAVARTIQITGRIIGMEHKYGFIVVEGPRGRQRSFNVPNRQLLDQLQVGDLVQATYNEDLLLRVSKN